MQVMPIPIFLPSSSSCEVPPDRKVFIKIKDDYRNVRNKLDVLIKQSYGDGCYLDKDDNISYDEEIRFDWDIGLLSGFAMFAFLGVVTMIIGFTFYNDSPEIIKTIFDFFFSYANDDFLTGVALFLGYIGITIVIIGFLAVVKDATRSYRKRTLYMTRYDMETIINFELNGNCDYAFYLSLLKEFKIKNRVMTEE